MKVKGKRVLLSKPVVEKSPIEMTSEVQESIERANMLKWTHLEVFAIGDDVQSVKAGDKVYVTKSGLESCEAVEIEGEVKIIIPESSIALIW